MKQVLYMSLFTIILLTGCGGSGDSESESGENSGTHYQGQSCASCHKTGSAAEGKYFRSGATVYSGLNSSTYVDGYSIRLLMDNNVPYVYSAGRGTGNQNSGLYNTGLDGYASNKFTAQLLSNGTVVKSSTLNSHDSARLDCNSCHTAAGANGAPGRISPTTTTTSPSTTTGTLSFATDVMPTLKFSCLACHGSNGRFSITSTDASATYANINSFSGINTTTPANSYLLQKATNTISHGGGAVWTTNHTYYTTLKTWIEQGAKNN